MNPVTRLICTWALVALSAASLEARNVFVVPESVDGTNNILVFSGTPLAQAASIPVTTGVAGIFARPTQEPADVRYYIVTASNIRVFDAAFNQIGSAISSTQPIVVAGLSPDGQRLLAVAGNVIRIFNTTGGGLTEITPGTFIDIGAPPITALTFSSNSRTAFVTTRFQRLTAVDLTNNQQAGTIPLPGITEPPSLATGPNGFIYVSAQNRVYEIDPNVLPLSSSSVRRTFTLATEADVGRLHFTPDGTRAIAVNRRPQSGALLYFFSLHLLGPGAVRAVPNTLEGFTGVTFATAAVVSNERGYVISSPTSNPRQAMYQVNIPALPANINDPLPIPTLSENFFAGEGTVPIVSGIALSKELPLPSRMFLNAPFRILQPAATDALLVINPQNNYNRIETVNLPFSPGPAFFAGPASTAQQDPVFSLVAYNETQPELNPGARTLPFGVRVIGASGQPLFNQPVVFTPITQGVQLDGPPSVNTNSDGIALSRVVAPTTPGAFTVRVTAGVIFRDFTFTVSGSANGGGGGGQPGQPVIEILAGNGQLIDEGDFTREDLTVRLLDGQGNPIPNRTVAWTVTQGSFSLSSGATTTTGSDGTTSQRVLSLAPLVFGNTIQFGTITATAAGIGEATFQLVVYPRIIEGQIVPKPTVVFLAPTSDPPVINGQIGQTIAGAIRIRVNAPFVIPGSPAIRNVGLSVNTVSGPRAECVPARIVLTDETGEATCNLRILGTAGTTNMVVNIGNFMFQNFTLTATPGVANAVRIVAGNNQSGNPGQALSPLVVRVEDGANNPLPGISVRWQVVSGTATLNQNVTTTGSNGQAAVNVTLGSTPGTVVIRATALSGPNPVANFALNINVQATGFAKVSGDNQTAIVNTAFPAPLVVRVTNAQGAPVPNVSVGFQVTAGSATLSAPSATTNAEGLASVSVTAGANPGAIVVTATLTGVGQVTFNLTANPQPPPVPDVSVLDVYNTASGERGRVVPGGIYTVVIRGYVPDLNGFVVANTVTGPLPTRLRGVEVQFGNTLAPIYHIGRSGGTEVVTVQAPFEMAAGGNVWIVVRRIEGGVAGLEVPVVDYQPALFVHTDTQGRRFAVAIRPDGSYVTPDNPARRGEIVRFFATGVGQVTPLARTGFTGIPGQRVAAEFAFGINHQGVRVVSATYAEGMVGVYEFAVEIPADAQVGSEIPVGMFIRRPTGEAVFALGSTIPIAP